MQDVSMIYNNIIANFYINLRRNIVQYYIEVCVHVKFIVEPHVYVISEIERLRLNDEIRTYTGKREITS